MLIQIGVAALLLSGVAFGQSVITDQKLIAYAKGLDVSRLDPSLPHQRLEEWLDERGFTGGNLLWRRSDCNLMPSFSQPNEPRPLCVDFVITVRADAGVIAIIRVGTDQKGIVDPPKLESLYMMQGPIADLHTSSAERLFELPRLVEAARSHRK